MSLPFRIAVLMTSLLILNVSSIAQIEITSSDLPDAGDLLVQENAVLADEVNYTATGADYTWTFGENEITLTGATTETDCINISSTPFVYQVFFNSQFDPEHDSDYAVGVESFEAAGITLEDAYFYFQNRTDRFAQTGGGATIMSVPTGAQGDPVDVIYELPLLFGDQTESYSELLYQVPTLGAYQTQQTRANNVDGWGTLNLFEESYEVLRVVTVINATDSVYIEFFGTGTTFDRPEVTEYKWLTPGIPVPVLQINETGGVVSQVLVKGEPVSIAETASFPFSWYYSAVTNEIRISGNYHASDRYMIHDAHGKLVQQGSLTSPMIALNAQAQGGYLFSVLRHGQVFSGKWVK
jgi:hypothetical protein